MDFFSIIVLVFYFLIIVYFLADNIMFRNIILLLISVLFYAWGQLTSVIVILIISSLNYLSGLAIDRYYNTKPLTAKMFFINSIILNIGVYIVFRYASIILFDASTVLGFFYEIPEYILPIGMVIFTFQSISYISDVYLQKVPVQKNYFHLLLYISLFPQIPVGPIVKYANIYEQFKTRSATSEDVVIGFYRFLAGFIKIFIFSYCSGNTSSFLLNDNLSAISSAGAWIGIFLLSCHIYFWFSGFSDISIGLARVFGFKYNENFNYPYLAKSVTDFWNRWNISLNSFFNEYIPKLFGKKFKSSYISILMTSLLIGLWYGLSLNYLYWGLYYAILLMIEKKLSSIDVDISSTKIINTVVTLLAVMFGWAIFYFKNFYNLNIFIEAIFGLKNRNIGLTIQEATAIHEIFWLIPVLIIACTPLPAKLGRKLLEKRKRFIFAIQSLCLIIVISLIMCFTSIEIFSMNVLSKNVYISSKDMKTSNTSIYDWLDGTYVTQVKNYISYYTSEDDTFASIIKDGKALFRNNYILQVAKKNYKDQIHNMEEEQVVQTVGSNITNNIYTIDGSQKNIVEADKEEMFYLTDNFIIFEDKAIELFHYNKANVEYTWQTYNRIMDSIPEGINKYLLVAPMRICFEDEKYQSYSDNLKTTIDEIYSKMPPDVNTIDAYSLLNQHKDEIIFLDTDYYWTPLGAYYGAQAFSSISGIKIKDIAEYEERALLNYQGSYASNSDDASLHKRHENLAYYLNKDISNSQLVHKENGNGIEIVYESPAIALSRRGYSIFLGKDITFSIIKGDVNNGKSLMVLGDSYVKSLAPWLIPCYEEIIYINPDKFRKGKSEFRQLLIDYSVTDLMIVNSGRNISKSDIKNLEKACFLEP